jgi:hypothetical protein
MIGIIQFVEEGGVPRGVITEGGIRVRRKIAFGVKLIPHAVTLHFKSHQEVRGRAIA